MVIERSMQVRIVQLERMQLRNGKGIWLLTLDCSYLSLLQFTANKSSEPRKKRKRKKKGMPESSSRLETTLVSNLDRRPVDADIAFINPLDANALVSIPDSPGVAPTIGDEIEFAVVAEQH